MSTSHSDPTHFTERIAELRTELLPFDPFILATNTGSTHQMIEPGKGAFHLLLWGRETELTYPELVAYDRQTGKELPLTTQALLLYYFTTADGTPHAGRWVSFSELAGGKFYNQAFQGYSGQELVKVFQNDRQAFEQAAEQLGGMRQNGSEAIPLGEAAYSFRALPRLPLLVVFWPGDEESLADFPPSFQILFDASADHYLPTDVCAILGGMLARKLIAEKRGMS